jgi:hypothetical protein
MLHCFTGQVVPDILKHLQIQAVEEVYGSTIEMSGIADPVT